MLDKLKSRKFWVTVVTGLLVAANDQLGLMPPDSLLTLVGLVAAYILGQSAVDAVAAKPPSA